MDSYRIAGIDVHKRMLAVVVADVAAGEGPYEFERREYGTTPDQLEQLRQWLQQTEVRVAVMESTAQYWKPVWRALEGQCELQLAQAQSNRAPRGRKRDFEDAERLVRRLVAGELRLSFVPDRQQRMWRMLTHAKYQATQDRAKTLNQLEAFLEDAGLKLSGFVSTLKGVSSRRILEAVSKGESSPARLAELADPGLKATAAQLEDALRGAATMDPCCRKVLGIFLERLSGAERRIEQLHELTAREMKAHNDAVVRLSEMPGLGVDSAQQIIAELGPEAATFPTAGDLASWIGVCPGANISANVPHGSRSPKGNVAMRRILLVAAEAALKAKGSIFEKTYRRWVTRMKHKEAVWAVAHKMAKIIWKVLHDRVRYEERGLRTNPAAAKKRASRLVAQLKRLGYSVQIMQVKGVGKEAIA